MRDLLFRLTPVLALIGLLSGCGLGEHPCDGAGLVEFVGDPPDTLRFELLEDTLYQFDIRPYFQHTEGERMHYDAGTNAEGREVVGVGATDSTLNIVTRSIGIADVGISAMANCAQGRGFDIQVVVYDTTEVSHDK